MWPCPCWWLFVLLAPCSLGKGEARGWAFGSPLLLLHLECRVPALPKGRDATREAVHILSRHQCMLMVRETKLLLVSCPDLSLTCFRLPSPGGGWIVWVTAVGSVICVTPAPQAPGSPINRISLAASWQVLNSHSGLDVWCSPKECLGFWAGGQIVLFY